ncbi:DNA internalization-related competence protein ComEC/Rec2 [Bacillus alveayuensis]|uniref:DNA internalization-related competence protein ComEC/Rec2 n=1 Tax=Aeribacillus alveayuensis TaxID=279215 RepID=UPI000698E43E|nr:DNA internalization-related competence protein ComEC/Rec2 [Bacillus alveayuensis]
MKGQWTYVAMTVLLASIASFSAFLVFICLVIWINKKYSMKTSILYMTIYILMFTYSSYVQTKNVTIYSKGEYKGYGKIIESPSIDGEQMSFIIEMDGKEKIKSYYTFQKQSELEKAKQWRSGAVCFFEGELIEPKQNTIENGFNYKKNLNSKKIHWIFYVTSIRQCQDQRNIFDQLQLYRETIQQFIESHYPDRSSGFVQALIIGERRNIEEGDYQVYQQLGIVHLLAISGLHVGFMTGFLYWLLLRLGLTKEQVILLLCFMLPIFAMITGAAPSVLRACLMAEIFLLSQLFYKSVIPEDCISISFIMLFIINPFYVDHIGFQLSYIISYALIFSQPLLKKCHHPFQTVIMVTLLSQVSSFPIVLYHFYEFSPLSVIVNLLYVPLYVYLLLPFSFITIFLLLMMKPLGKMAVSLHHAVFDFSLQFAEMISDWKIASITVGAISEVSLVFIYIIIFYFMIHLEKSETIHRTVSLILKLIVVLFLYVIVMKAFQPGEVTFIDVGQGDAIFIREPGFGNAFLIDTGGIMTFDKEDWQKKKSPFSIGEDILIPFLKSKGVATLDGLFLTHGDIDHVGEAITILESVHVKHLFIPKFFIKGDMERSILSAATEKGVNIVEVSGGDQISISPTFLVLSPLGNPGSSNDGSLVLYAKIGGKRWLFTGDLEEEGEFKLLNVYPNLQVDVLKVGHHGSRTSSSEAFLHAIKPTYAIISVGRNNRYNHPHQEVLTRLHTENVIIFRTDEMGSIQYRFRQANGTFLIYPPYDIAAE